MPPARKKDEPLTREDLIGRTLTAVYEQFQWDVNGIDLSFCYFVLDSGTVFFLPGCEAGGLLSHELPSEAEQIYEDEHGTVTGQRIVALLRERPDADLCLESLCLLLENGWLIWHVCGANHGTGYAGVKVERPGEIDLAQLEVIWQWQPASDLDVSRISRDSRWAASPPWRPALARWQAFGGQDVEPLPTPATP